MNKEYNAQKQKEYRQRNPQYKQRWSMMGIKKQIRDRLGNKCNICLWDGLCHIHHINPDYISHHFKISEIPNYKLLCPNCHYSLHRKIGRRKNIIRYNP